MAEIERLTITLPSAKIFVRQTRTGAIRRVSRFTVDILSAADGRGCDYPRIALRMTRRRSLSKGGSRDDLRAPIEASLNLAAASKSGGASLDWSDHG